MLDGAHDLAALAKGFWTVLRHAARPSITQLYPEVKRRLPAAFRGRHRLYRHAQEDGGLERCIGCELCAAACPSGAIFVQAADNDPLQPTSTGERFAAVYEINMLRCIFCGYCEEACPVDAIRLGPEYELADFDRKNFVYTKSMLLDPEKFAPARQYHKDVDDTDPELHHVIPATEDLGLIYERHRPLGAARPTPATGAHDLATSKGAATPTEAATLTAAMTPTAGAANPPSEAPATRATTGTDLSPHPDAAPPEQPAPNVLPAGNRPPGPAVPPGPAAEH